MENLEHEELYNYRSIEIKMAFCYQIKVFEGPKKKNENFSSSLLIEVRVLVFQQVKTLLRSATRKRGIGQGSSQRKVLVE